MTMNLSKPESSLEKKIAKRLLALNPGMGAKAGEVAMTLADSGLGPIASSLVIAAIYGPSDAGGRGQTTRAKWFVDAVRSRYSTRLDAMRRDTKQLQTFIFEMEEMTDMRDTLKGEGFGISFNVAFLLSEIGMDSESACTLMDSVSSRVKYKGTAVAIVTKAAQYVKAGNFSNIETAVEEHMHELWMQ